MRAYEKLQAYWHRTHSRIITHARSDADIAALEARYGVRLPEDYREFLLNVCPEGDVMDDDYTDWWPVERVQNVPDELGYPLKNGLPPAVTDKCLFFADHMIWCGAWAIACGDDLHRGFVIFVDTTNDRIVAPSFTDFVDRYIADWQSIAWGAV